MSVIQQSLKRVVKMTAAALTCALLATSANAAEKVYRLKLADFGMIASSWFLQTNLR